ncbi:MAG: hypothetical protein V1663_00430 [archaeon]
MEKEKLKVLEKFINEKLPEAEKDRVILIVDDTPLSWKQILEVFKKGGEFADKVEKEFEEMKK